MTAVFSPCRTWRYVLRRDLAPLEPYRSRVLFVCLNPSTADEHIDDPTVRRIAGYARGWGYTDLTVCNLFAFRATDPRELGAARDPVGPGNDRWLQREARQTDLVVAAWGAHGTLHGRAAGVLGLLRRAGPEGRVYCLGTTRAGEPLHPLYLPRDRPLVPLGAA